MRWMCVVLIFVGYLDLAVQVVGLLFFGLPPARAALHGVVGLLLGSSFLALLVYSRRTDALSHSAASN